VKIAVVGSGISGLTAAHYLSRTHEVHVFEADGRAGGHTHTVEANVPSGTYPVDTGFIVFNDWTYPNFIRLMDSLGVASRPSDMSFSVKSEPDGLEYNGTTLNTLFAQRRNLFRPAFHRMVLDILRFNKEAAAARPAPGTTLGAFLAAAGYGRMFVDRYVVPMGAAIWSTGAEKALDIPAAFFFTFFKNHGMLSVDDRPQWRVIKGGSRSYLGPLTKPFAERLRLSTPVRRVARKAQEVELVLADGSAFRADEVVLAGHADQMLALLSDPSDKERELLAAFPYQENETVLHTDVSVLPVRRRAWAAWNYLVPKEPRDRVAVTYDMNILQSLEAPETFCVSLNMSDRIDPAKVLKRLTYHHPLYTREGVAAQASWGSISGKNRTHYAGAYWRNGFHEDGVVSALRVCEALGVRP
jgi:predicted NAD/FAD-binding protein